MWIELGIINYKLIIPFIYPLFYQIRRVIHKGDQRPLFEFFTNYVGYLLGGLLYLIERYRTKRKKQEIIEEDNNNKEVHMIIYELQSMIVADDDNENPSEKKMSKKLSFKKKRTNQLSTNLITEVIKKYEKINLKKKYLYILFLVLIYFIPMFLDSYSIINNSSNNFTTSSSVSLFFSIISYVLLSRIILGDKIYKHQIFSLIIILVANIIIIILVLADETNDGIYINLVFIISIVVLYCLYNNLVKRYFNIYMGSPYYLMFIIGLMSLIFIILYEIITDLSFGKERTFNGILYQFELNIKDNNLYFLIFLGDIISALFWIGGIILTMYFFSPCHFIISESISQIISTLIENSLEKCPIYKQVIIYISFVVIIIGSLIYNEVIIINIFSLNTNTQKNIILRQKEETEEIRSDMISV